MPAVKNVGEPCAGKPHARFDGEGLETEPTGHRASPSPYETLPQRSETMIYWAMIDNMGRRLTSESTQTWRDDPAETGKPSVT
jgi:hypothetical protein